MVPKIKREKVISEVFALSDVRFEYFNKEKNTIAGKPATPSEIAIHQDCPYVIHAYGRRMFTDLSVAQRIFQTLRLQTNISPTPENIVNINNALIKSTGKKTFFLSLTDGISSKDKPFTEIIVMDVIDPRKIKKEIKEADVECPEL